MLPRLALLPAFLISSALWADDPPHLWLERMVESVETLNYHGTLVYMRPGKAETFGVYHRVQQGVVQERVVELDGSGAEIIRTAEEVMCIFPAQQKVVIDKRGSKPGKENPLRSRLPSYSSAMADYYQLDVMPTDRVVGRRAVVVSIKPADGYRYGYQIWLDEQTAIPLKTQLIAPEDDAMPVEELFFTTIDLPESLPDEMVESSIETAEFTWVRHGESGPREKPAAMPAWEAGDLPTGFMQTTATLEFMAGSESPRLHLVFSDGLASISVFVDEGVAAGEQAEGLTTVGAANAYSVMLEGFLVTAMGEVPAKTVQRVARSMVMSH